MFFSIRNILLLFLLSGVKLFAQTGINYFPLNIGNLWQHKYMEADSVSANPYHIYDTISVNDTVYYKFGDVETYPYLIRSDSLGRVWQRIEDKEVIWLDFTLDDSAQYEYDANPSIINDFPYIVTVKRNLAIDTFAGHFENCIEFFFDIPESFDEERWYVFAPDIGPIKIRYAHGVILLLSSAVIEGKVISSTEEKSQNIATFKLKQNYPNPFNSNTVISWQLAVGSHVDLSIYNMLGQKVVTLVSGKQKAGYHEVEFKGQNLSSGVYLYRIEASEWSDVKKMILLR